MKRCAIYTRESLLKMPEQIQNSIKIQKLFCERFIQEHQGWILIDDEYDDVGYDADTLDRPALQRLFNDIQRFRIDYLIVNKINRLASSTPIYSEILQTLTKSNVNIVPVMQIEDDFLTSENPLYTISAEELLSSDADREFADLATKYLHMPNTKISGSLLGDLVKCSICGETMTNISRSDGRVYICKNHLMNPINATKCNSYVIDEIRKLLREPALTGLVPWQLEKLNITHADAFQITESLDKIWSIIPASEVKRIIHLIVQNVIVNEDSNVNLILQPNFIEKILEEVGRIKNNM